MPKSHPAAGVRRRARFRPEVGALEDRQLLTLMGNQLFPSDNAWNQKITNAPVAGNSTAIIGNITTLYGNGAFHPDFVQYTGGTGRLYGIPVNVVRGNTATKVPVVVDGYPGESDLVSVPIPANAVVGGDFENRPNPNPVDRGDSHLLVYDADNNISYELFYARRPSENADGKWHAYQLSVWDMKVNTFRTLGYTSADAAGLSILAGLARPDEALPVSQGGQGVINHAIRMTLQNSVILGQFTYPASHEANVGTNAAILPPMGTRMRLKAGVDISNLNPQAKVVAQAMKDYGLIVADNGSNFYASGASYVVDAAAGKTYTWSDADIQDRIRGLKALRFSDFEVVDLKPIVTSLSAPGGVAGDTVTITGQNFSGAAGRLKVLFGGVEATGVTVLDDTRVRAVVPAGSGVVDVRVQSGITASNPGNFTNPVFGYGVSNVVATGRFTYGAAAPSTSVTFVSADTTTQGNWQSAYGADGYNVIGNAQSLPSYASLAASGQNAWTWAASTADVRGLRKPASATDRIAATWYGSSVKLDVRPTDTQAHTVSLYLLDWDRQGRSQRIDVLNPTTGAVLDTRTVSNFANGTFLTWSLKGPAQFRITPLAGPNAVVSGVFFGGQAATPPPATPNTATFVSADTTTQGNWQSAYGADGYNVIGNAQSLPSYASLAASGQNAWTWAASTADVRGLRKPASATDRIAATWYGSSVKLDVGLNDGLAHTVSLSLLDWDRQGRSQRIDVLDPTTGAVLDTRTVSSFGGGTYLTWRLTGRVQFRLTALSGPNAVVSGIFFGGKPA